jgi:Tetratricopeptide repeat
MLLKKPKLINKSDNSFFIRKKTSKKLVIFFTGTRAEKTPGYFNFWEVGRLMNANVLFINNGRAEWYQEGIPSIANTFKGVVAEITTLKEYLGVVNLYAIGQSMGGFGAIRYGEALGADILAVGTETRLCIPKSRSELRLPKDVTITVPDVLPILARHKGRAVLLAGESDPVDMFSLMRVAHLQNLEVFSYRNVEHSVFSQLKRQGLLAEYLNQFLQRGALIGVGNEGVAWKSRTFCNAFYRQFRVFMEAKWAATLTQGEIAIKLEPNNIQVRYMMGYAQSALRIDQKALENSKYCYEAGPDNLKFKHLYGLALRRVNKNIEAIKIQTEVIEINDELIGSYFEIAQSYFALRQYDNVIRYCEHALAISPDFERAKNLIIRVQKRLAM